MLQSINAFIPYGNLMAYYIRYGYLHDGFVTIISRLGEHQNRQRDANPEKNVIALPKSEISSHHKKSEGDNAGKKIMNYRIILMFINNPYIASQGMLLYVHPNTSLPNADARRPDNPECRDRSDKSTN